MCCIGALTPSALPAVPTGSPVRSARHSALLAAQPRCALALAWAAVWPGSAPQHSVRLHESFVRSQPKQGAKRERLTMSTTCSCFSGAQARHSGRYRRLRPHSPAILPREFQLTPHHALIRCHLLFTPQAARGVCYSKLRRAVRQTAAPPAGRAVARPSSGRRAECCCLVAAAAAAGSP
jgi:hypothetical protein